MYFTENSSKVVMYENYKFEFVVQTVFFGITVILMALVFDKY